MTFQDEIKNYEFSNSPYIIKMGLTPVILVTPTFNQEDLSSKTIARYVSNQTESSFLINISESDIENNLKPTLLKIINNQNIKLLISIILNSKDNGFDLQIETSKNLVSMYDIIKNLQKKLKTHHINAIYNKNYNDKFKYNSIDIIQIELNPKYLQTNNLEDICNSLTEFIAEYLNK